jgi:hypothetical protein
MFFYLGVSQITNLFLAESKLVNLLIRIGARLDGPPRNPYPRRSRQPSPATKVFAPFDGVDASLALNERRAP